MPPQPPTFRARVGAVLVNIVRRMLFWYTEQIRAQNKRIAEAAREQARILHALSAAEREQAAVARATAAEIDTIRAQTQALADRLNEMDRQSKESRRVDEHFFVQHAAAFRGQRDEISKRLAVYLPYAQKAYADTGNLPALDLGCGRGEWLEILQHAGIPATGIDVNSQFIAGCRERGLDATEGDLVQALASIPAQSRAIVSAIHVLEHLSFKDLLEVVDQSVRILKPGGIAIFETPNPKNVIVSSNNFYLDPTHHHPLPSEFLAFVLSTRGLSDLEVLPLVPFADEARLQEESQAAAFLNEHFFSALDYGIVARKP
jgi:predicted TPR repeat methyltransferase